MFNLQNSHELHHRINTWYQHHARDLPWRRADCTAWGVMVSEFMLQQTPVNRVLPVWEEWMRRWPTPASLAAEDSAEAVRAWGRLGYPRRAQRLHGAAVAITKHHDGEVPADYDELLELPGVGAYTAAAITVFAFGRRATVIDTNIRRVHARAVTGKALPHKHLNVAETTLAEELMPQNTAVSCVWNASVMELGALVCVAKNPRCEQCPLEDICAWVKAGKPQAEYTPTGQSWHGTDRQLRGAMMAVLRAAHAPVPRELLTDFSTDITVPDALKIPVQDLRKLDSSQEQIDRCYSGLLKDKLAKERKDRVSL